MSPTVYLAGPVTGQTSSGAKDWRARVDGLLYPRGIKCISPVRDAPRLEQGETYKIVHSDDAIGGSRQAIRTKCKFDVAHCDVVLGYLPKSEWPSVGTIIEVARAQMLGKVVILVIDADEPRLAHHPILLSCADAVFPDLPTATEYIASLLSTYARL